MPKIRLELQLLLDAVVAWSEQLPCISDACIFGSFVRGDLTPDSDIDIGVDLVRPLEGEALVGSYGRLQATKCAWGRELSRRFGRRIELHGINVDDKADPARAAVLEARADPQRCLAQQGKVFVVWTEPHKGPRRAAPTC